LIEGAAADVLEIAHVADVVGVVGDGLDVLEGPGIEMLPGLTVVTSALGKMVEVGNDAGGYKEVAAFVKVDPPGIAGAVRVDFELLADRMIAPEARVDGNALLVRSAGASDPGMGEDAVATVEPAV